MTVKEEMFDKISNWGLYAVFWVILLVVAVVVACGFFAHDAVSGALVGYTVGLIFSLPIVVFVLAALAGIWGNLIAVRKLLETGKSEGGSEHSQKADSSKEKVKASATPPMWHDRRTEDGRLIIER